MYKQKDEIRPLPHTIHKNQFQYLQSEAMKLLESMREKFHNINQEKDFLYKSTCTRNNPYIKR